MRYNIKFLNSLPSYQIGGVNPFGNFNIGTPLNTLDPISGQTTNNVYGLFNQKRLNEIEEIGKPPSYVNPLTPNFNPTNIDINANPNQALFDYEDSVGLGQPQITRQPIPTQQGIQPDFTRDGEELDFQALEEQTLADTEFLKGIPISRQLGIDEIMTQENQQLFQRADRGFDGPTPFSPPETQRGDKYFNPYGGTDLESAIFTLGQSFKSEGSTANTMRGIGAGAKATLNIGRLLGAGMGVASREREVMDFYREKQRKGLVNNFIGKDGGLFQYFKNGGTVSKLSPEKALTGEYITGLPDHSNREPNSELEKKEYVQHPNGDVQKVVGDSHKNGGEKMELEPGTKIISDNLKLGKELAKEFKINYDVNAKATDTFAKIIDKYNKKIGLQKLNDEQEELFKKVKKEEETEDKSTSNLNLEFLSGRINDIEKEKEVLLEDRKQFVDFIFEKQEESKGVKEEEELEVFEKGGMVKDKRFQKLLKKYNLSEEDGVKLVKQYKNGGKRKGRALATIPEGQSLTEEGVFGKAVLQETIDTNPWFDWSNFDPKDKSDVKRFQSQYNAITTGDKVEVDGKFGEQTASIKLLPTDPTGVQRGIQPDQIDIRTPLGIDTAAVTIGEEDKEQIDSQTIRKRLGLPLLPSQRTLPPESLQAHTKISRRFEQLDPVIVSPEENIKEIFRSQDFATEQLSNLPDSQRRAALANLTASSQESINKAISTANIANAQNLQRTEQFNIGQSNLAENYRAADTLDFEKRQLTALGKTQADLFNYFEFNRKINLGNFNTVTKMNLLNDLYENFNIGQTGGIDFQSPTSPLFSAQSLIGNRGNSQNNKSK